MNPVIIHNKTYQERLAEYSNVLLVDANGHLPASKILSRWSSYLELLLDPTDWLAVWKLPRLTCEQLEIEFPITAFVFVEAVNYEKLTASVKILAIHDNVHLPYKHFLVSLIELWPTEEQDKKIMLSDAANCLEMLRVFYFYIFMPWDLDEDDCTNWINEHLESRLTLLYDMRNTKFPRHTAVRLKDLMTEARHLQVRQKKCSDDDGYNPNLLHIRIRMIQIRNEVEFLENPLLRGAYLRKQHLPPKLPNSNSSTHIMVFQQNKIDEYISFLNDAKSHIAQQDVKFVSNLNSALEIANVNDSILLNKSKHIFENFGVLQQGGNLKGLYSKSETVVESTKEDIVFDCCGDVTFENLTIHVRFAQCGILVQNGNLTLKNCKIVCDFESHSCDGIIVLTGATLNVVDCDLSGFDRAIVANLGSSVSLKSSAIVDVNTGLTIFDNSNVKVESCVFKRCEEFGIGIETSTTSVECQTGDFDILKKFPFIIMDNITGEGNGVDGNIICTVEVDIVQDLLNPQSDDSSGEEMDTTVV